MSSCLTKGHPLNCQAGPATITATTAAQSRLSNLVALELSTIRNFTFFPRIKRMTFLEFEDKDGEGEGVLPEAVELNTGVEDKKEVGVSDIRNIKNTDVIIDDPIH